MELIIIFLLYCLACTGLAHAVTTSELAFRIKKLLFLDKEYDSLTLFSRWLTYKKLFGNKVWYALPLILILITVFKLHRLVYELLLCTLCTSFQISFWIAIALGFGVGIAVFAGLIAYLIALKLI